MRQGSHEPISVAFRRGCGRAKWRPLVAVVLAVSTIALVGVSSAHGFADRFGVFYLQEPCCGGDPLEGTGASIEGDALTPDKYFCILFRSDAENSNGTYAIQAGLARCGTNGTLDGTCSLSNNLIKFVEKVVASSFTCYPHGAASLFSEYDTWLADGSGTTWFAYINGTAYESSSFTGNLIDESGEHTSTDSCSGWSGHAVFADDGLWPWQRYVKATRTWTQIQASQHSHGCWTLNGGPPSPFDISH